MADLGDNLKAEDSPQAAEPINQDGSSFNPKVSTGSEAISLIWEFLKIVVVAVALVFVIKTYLTQPFCVKGQSMQETYNDEDYILIDKLSYRINPPKRFDVIVFKYPYDQTEYYIKRIIGLPGESVEIKNSQVIIYNSENPEGMVLNEASYLLPEQKTSGVNRTEIKADNYFVLGDNRPQSSDSRYWGQLEKKFITGRVFVRVLPQSRFCALITSTAR